ncbi:hypothetical protein [Actinomadura sp. SCN-SB]|uniref:hypothetical protein n=1 Tax=Actinomadura sp. SCN-SB TaxID=3373092 RepID=UPI0037506783
MLTTGPAPLAVDGAAVGHGLPRRQIPLNELRSILLRPATGRRACDAAWRHVTEEAQSGAPAWVIGAVGLALPALWRIAGDLAEGYRGEAEELHAAMLAGFVDALHRLDTGRPAIITRLRWAAYRAGLLARYSRQALLPMSQSRPESAPPPQPWGHPDLLLADAVAKRVLSPLAAELIGRSRLEDMTLKQAAAELGVGVQAAYKARQRGERRLVAAIVSGDVDHQISGTGMSNPELKSGFSSAQASDSRPASRSRAGAAEQRPGAQTAGVRGRSARSDGTSDTESAAQGGEAFCGPAPQSPPQRQPSSPSPSPSSSSPSSQRSSSSRSGRRRGRGKRETPGRSRGTP